MAAARSPFVRTALFVTGVLVIAVSPLVGILPGPGGIFVFAAGLVLVLRNSARTQRAFCRAKRRWPRFGHYADMALRRRSARRRRLREGEAEIARTKAELPGLRNGTR
ncbi:MULTISPECIES: hypothetical protein [unclassified Sphingomonas]|jgi:hypothetical protein|nr:MULTISPECIES: hypothetical protein [unclassified Sphingomonas]